MTNVEAIEILRGCVVSEERENGKPNGNITCDLTREVLDMAIAALEKRDELAADVVEVRHGRWIKVHDEVCYWLACSVCGEETPKRFGTYYYTSYCPNCGARMDGGAEDG